MRTAIFAYSRQACRTADRIRQKLGPAEIRAYTLARFRQAGFTSLEPGDEGVYREAFAWAQALVFVGALGIAVRKLAPYIRSKQTDPAVLCVDELATYVIPLLSGHIGGANRLANRLADDLGAQAIITTATDLNQRFAVDSWATERGFVLSDLGLAKAVSAAILEGDLPLLSDLALVGDLPSGLYLDQAPGQTGPDQPARKGQAGLDDRPGPGSLAKDTRPDLGIYLGWRIIAPFKRTLRVIPPLIHLGLGCRRGTDQTQIQARVEATLDQFKIDQRAIKSLASIDLKADEPGLLAYARNLSRPIKFYSADQLKSLPGQFTASAFVEKITGIDNVCERAALYGADRLLVRKQTGDGVSLALALENMEVDFV